MAASASATGEVPRWMPKPPPSILVKSSTSGDPKKGVTFAVGPRDTRVDARGEDARGEDARGEDARGKDETMSNRSDDEQFDDQDGSSSDELTMVDDGDGNQNTNDGDAASATGTAPIIKYVDKKNPEKTQECPTCGKKYAQVRIHYKRSKEHEPERFARLQKEADPEKKGQPDRKNFKSTYTYANAVQEYIDRMLEKTQGPDIHHKINKLECALMETKTRISEQGLHIKEMEQRMSNHIELEKKIAALEAAIKANDDTPAKRAKVEQRVSGLEKWTEDTRSWNRKNWADFDRRIKELESAEGKNKGDGEKLEATQFRIKPAGKAVKMSIFFDRKMFTKAMDSQQNESAERPRYTPIPIKTKNSGNAGAA